MPRLRRFDGVDTRQARVYGLERSRAVCCDRSWTLKHTRWSWLFECVSSFHQLVSDKGVRRTESVDPVHREQWEDDYRMELRKLIRQGLVERSTDGHLRLHSTIAAAGYVLPRDPYTRGV